MCGIKLSDKVSGGTSCIMALPQNMRINTAKRRMLEGKPTLGTLIGLGASAISQVPAGFVQNNSSLRLYKQSLKVNNALPIARGFVLRDRNYLSARWPGDIYNFSNKFFKMIQEKVN